VSALLLALWAGCAALPVDAAAAPQAAAPQVATPASAGANPLTSIHRTPGAADVHGRVEEVHDASHYRYLRVVGEDGATGWYVVLSRAPVAAGQEVTLKPFGTLDHYQSPALGREFSPLTFSLLR